MPAKLIFIAAATVAAIGSAVLAGIITAVACLSAKVPTATLITLTAGSAAAVFGGVIALSGMTASLLFNGQEPVGRKPSATPPARRHNEAGRSHIAEIDQFPDDATDDNELRAALKARALVLCQTRGPAYQRAWARTRNRTRKKLG